MLNLIDAEYQQDKKKKQIYLSNKKINEKTIFANLITSAIKYEIFPDRDHISKIKKLRLIRNRSHIAAFKKEAYKYYNYSSLQYYSLFFQDFINALQIQYSQL